MNSFGLDESLASAPADPVVHVDLRGPRLARASALEQDKAKVPQIMTATKLGHTFRLLSKRPAKGKFIPKGSIMVDVASVGLLIDALAEQVKSGGVDFNPPEVRGCLPFWSHRDRCWIARANAPDGTKHRTVFHVKTAEIKDGCRRFLTLAEIDVERESAFNAAPLWQASVRDGLV